MTTSRRAGGGAAKSAGPARENAGRAKQKSRTRAALLSAAGRLIAAGRTPNVAEVADAADVSRRTAYRYFPTQEQLLVEAALEALRPEVESAMAGALPPARHAPGDDIEDARARLESLVHAIHRLMLQHERLLRTMIRLTAMQSNADGPVRGYRRVDWIESAVAPVRRRLGASRFARLVSSLALCVGTDALIVLQDVRGLAPGAAERVAAWTAQALLSASIAEADAAGR
jgi:AcrR family transcriptional regulator